MITTITLGKTLSIKWGTPRKLKGCSLLGLIPNRSWVYIKKLVVLWSWTDCWGKIIQYKLSTVDVYILYFYQTIYIISRGQVNEGHFGCVLVPFQRACSRVSTNFKQFSHYVMTRLLLKTSVQRELTHKSAASEGSFPAKASCVFLVTGETWEPRKFLNFPSGYMEVTYNTVLQGDQKRESLDAWFLLKYSKWQTSWPR